MQNSEQLFFIDRSFYYMSRSIVDQAKPGRWDFKLLPIHFVAFMRFGVPELENKAVCDAMVCDLQSKKPISQKVRYTYIQLPFFDKSAEECDSPIDYWLYNLIHMETLDSLLFTDKNELFGSLSQTASYAALSQEDRRAYDRDLQAYRDITNQISTSYERGMEKGMERGMEKGMERGAANTIRNLVSGGISPELISKTLKISIEKIKQILKG